MSNAKCVYISGDKTQFISKKAVQRFKRDIKNNEDNSQQLESTKYF